jgi:hypothetical protein
VSRRAFLLIAAGGLVALILGRRLSPGGGRPATGGGERPRRADNLLETASGAGLELRPTPVDPHGPVFHLNGSAAFVWRHIDGQRSAKAIAALLAGAYGIPLAAARNDTGTCLNGLSKVGLAFTTDG